MHNCVQRSFTSTVFSGTHTGFFFKLTKNIAKNQVHFSHTKILPLNQNKIKCLCSRKNYKEPTLASLKKTGIKRDSIFNHPQCRRLLRIKFTGLSLSRELIPYVCDGGDGAREKYADKKFSPVGGAVRDAGNYPEKLYFSRSFGKTVTRRRIRRPHVRIFSDISEGNNDILTPSTSEGDEWRRWGGHVCRFGGSQLQIRYCYYGWIFQ